MKRTVYTLKGDQKREMPLPSFFTNRVRPDLIKRAVLSLQSKRRQPYGQSPWGNKKWVVEPRGKGYDTSRVSRTRGGMGQARVIPQAVGGRAVRSPSSDKKIVEDINKKEKLKALKSALAATADPNLVLLRGHAAEQVPEVPLILENKFEEIEKTSEVLKVLEQVGMGPDLKRAREGQTIRSGKGKRRGRKYRKKKSLLLVVSSKESKVIRAARNLQGLDVVPYEYLSVENLAPGAHPGRLTLFTEKALKLLQEKIENQLKKW